MVAMASQSTHSHQDSVHRGDHGRDGRPADVIVGSLQSIGSVNVERPLMAEFQLQCFGDVAGPFGITAWQHSHVPFPFNGHLNALVSQ